jgi:TolB-like protein/Tfp pilus assembly protein PilF
VRSAVEAASKKRRKQQKGAIVDGEPCGCGFFPDAAQGGRPKMTAKMVHREPLHLLLLGAFSLKRGVQPVGSLPKKAQALLAYLALHRGRSFAREQLATLLWGHSGSEQARRSLRQCLMSLRSALETPNDVLVADGDQITLSMRDCIDVDVTRFTALGGSSKLHELQTASEIYRDQFLAGMQIAAEPFADWVEVERRRFSSMMSDVLYRLAVAEAGAARTELAIKTAERLTNFDPLREDGHRLLMQILAAAGRRAAALKQFTTCVEILRRELGVEPEPETTQLADAIRRSTPDAAKLATRERLAKRAQAARDSGTAVGGNRRALDLPDKPSIAVVPFSNLSGDADKDYFADGIVEDLSIALGRIPWLFVIASSATGSYRGRTVDVRQIGAELGVRYVLRGSIRRAGNRVRVVVQLTDASNGAHIWADRFEGDLDNVFDIQDRVTSQVAAMIAPAVYAVEMERSQRKPPESLTAYDFYLQALRRFRVNLEENRLALKLLRKAIELDPGYGAAHGLAARCYQMQKVFGWLPPTDPELVVEGPRLARLAIEIGKSDSEALWMAGHVLAYVNGEHDHGLALIDKSLALNPSSASAWISSCFVRSYLPGETETALEHFGRAQRLNPLDSMHHIHWTAAAEAYFVAGRYEEASAAADKTLKEMPTYPPGLRMKVSACGMLGRIAEAQRYVQRLLAVNPDVTVALQRAYWEKPLQRSPQALEAHLEGLRRAGLSEE